MEVNATSRSVSREVVEKFYHALATRDMETLATYLDDDVVWTISGPVDILPFCGRRVGKDVVMDLLQRDIPTLLEGRRFIPQTMLVDGDSAAVLGKLSATKRAEGRAISYRIAHFIRFRNEKVIDYVAIIDSFDAVEQMLGYSLDTYDGYRVEGNIVTV
jgi:ketosteroid isomerase-like protein